MQRTKSKILSILLSLVMLLSLLPTTALAADTYPKANEVSVDGGKYFAEPGCYYFKNGATACSKDPKGSNATYDPITGTLTLDGYNGGSIEVGGTESKITVVLVGENSINNGSLTSAWGGDITVTSSSGGTLSISKTTSGSNPAIGIETGYGSIPTGNVTIKGSAEVTIKMTHNGTSTYENAYGIFAKGNITICENASVDITCATPNNTAHFGDYCNGLRANQNVTINTAGTIKINVVDAGDYSYGIYPMGGAILTKVGKMEVQGKKAGSSGMAVYGSASFDPAGYDTNETTATNVDGTTYYIATYTPKVVATITSVSATVSQPVKGQALDFTGSVASGALYSITSVEWFEGTDATGTPVTSPATAKANTKYTAKITLTAKSGESFADSVIIPTDYTKDSSTSNTLVLTRTFDETGSFPAAEVTAAPTAKSGLKYDGTKKDLLGSMGTASGGTMKYRLGESGEFTTAIPMATNAGTYTVYYKAVGDETHSDSAVGNISATIAPKNIDTVTIGAIANQPYTGNAITPDLTVTDGTANLEKGKDYTVSCTDTNAGNATLTINGTRNYTGTKTANFTIVAADQNPSFTTPKDLVKGGHMLDLRDLVSNAQGKMTFTIASGNAAILSGYTLTSTAAITGEVKINVSIAAKDVDGDNNNEYKAFHKDNAITVNVVDKTSDTSTMTVTQDGMTYGDTLPDYVLTNKPTGTGTETVLYTGTLAKDNSTYNSNTAPTEAGNYTIKVKYETATTIYEATNTFTISPKSISGMTVNLNKTTTVYDGNNQTVTVTVKDGASTLTKDTDYTVTGVTSGTNVSSYTVTVNGQGNYTNTAKATWEITAKDVKLTGGINATDRSYVKDNKTVSLTKGTLTFDGLVSGETLDVNIPATGTISNADAGNGKTVTYSGVTLADGTGKASNYKLMSPLPTVTVNITKANAPAAPTELKGYKGSALSTVTLPTGWSWVDGTLKMDTIGDQTFQANYAGDTNHQAGTNVDVTVKVVQKSSGGYYYAPTTAAVPDMPMLYRGCTGDAVKTLQDKLNALGYNSGSVDGIFGAKTYAAVTAFQKANSLGVDGIVGKLTWGKLYGVSPAMPVETTTVVGRPTVSYGSRGDAVRKLQELLNALGYDCGSVDGIFGSKTKAAVLAFQKANGLGVDGIVGPLTWAKLG